MRSTDLARLALGAALLAGCASAPPTRPAAARPDATPPAAVPAARPAQAGAAKPSGAYAAALKLMKAHQLVEAEAALLAVAAAEPKASGPPPNLGLPYARSNRTPPAPAASRS